MKITDFSKIWVFDFEFRARPGSNPRPVCLVAREQLSGQEHRIWLDGVEEATSAPFDIDADSLFIAYYASAEIGCHLALNWDLPLHIIDLYAEFRVETNGIELPNGKGLLGALMHYRLEGISCIEKSQMRDLILSEKSYSTAEIQAILDYCDTDVIATEKLLGAMWELFLDPMRLEHALQRGRYSKAVAHIESEGIPLDGSLLGVLQTRWESLQSDLIKRVDSDFHVYEDRTFKVSRFEEYLVRYGIEWPTTSSGRLALDEDTFSEQAKTYPQLLALKELRQALGKLRLNDLAVGEDSRNRCLLSMFSSRTGRNQPSTNKFMFGLPVWLRSLIKPTEGCGLAYIDWSQQEFGIAAALSRDVQMMNAYSSGDPYLAFAIQAGAVPANATKASHAQQREQFKACVLAVQYGMGEEALAKKIRQPPIYARELLRLHHATYSDFWKWSDGVLDFALTQRTLWTVFGWKLHIAGTVNPRSIRNFPMQANGAEMLRLACCMGTEAGIKIVAPVHDAVLIEARIEELEAVSQRMQLLMEYASKEVLSGFPLRSDIKYIRAPDRYVEDRGVLMWELVQELLSKPQNTSDQVLHETSH